MIKDSHDKERVEKLVMSSSLDVKTALEKISSFQIKLDELLNTLKRLNLKQAENEQLLNKLIEQTTVKTCKISL